MDGFLLAAALQLLWCLLFFLQLAAATWQWHSIDRDLFMRTFKGLDIIVHYQRLRKQLMRLQQLQHTPREPAAQQCNASAAVQGQLKNSTAWPTAAAAVSGHYLGSMWAVSRSERGGNTHTQPANTEQQMLLSVVDHYLADVHATLQEQQEAGAGEAGTGRPVISVLEICPDAVAGVPQGLDAAAGNCNAEGSAADVGVVRDSGSDVAAEAVLAQTLRVSSDWRIITDRGAAEVQQQQQQQAANMAVPAEPAVTGVFQAADSAGVPQAADLAPRQIASATSTASAPKSTSRRAAGSGSRSSSSNAAQQRPHQRVQAACAIQSVPAEAVTSMHGASKQLIEPPAESRRDDSNKSTPVSRGKHSARRSQPVKGGQDAAAMPNQQCAAFGNCVSATEVLGMLNMQQEQPDGDGAEAAPLLQEQGQQLQYHDKQYQEGAQPNEPCEQSAVEAKRQEMQAAEDQRQQHLEPVQKEEAVPEQQQRQQQSQAETPAAVSAEEAQQQQPLQQTDAEQQAEQQPTAAPTI